MKKLLITFILLFIFTLTALGQTAEYKIEDGTITFYGGKVIECVSFPSDTELHTVVIAEGVEEVTLAGHYTWNAKKLVLPSTLKYLTNTPGKCLTSLEEVEVNTERYFSFQGALYERVGGEVILTYYPTCKKDRSYKVYEGTTKISGYVFTDPKYLEEVEIFGNVDTKAFSESNIKKVILNSKEIKEGAFYSAKVEEVIFNEGIENIGKYAFKYCENITSISLPSTLKTVSDEAFALCSSLNKASFSGSVTLGTSAFISCANLETISFNEVGWSISPFSNCFKLKNIYVKKLNTVIKNIPPYLENLFYGGSEEELNALYVGSQYVNVIANSSGIEKVEIEPVALIKGLASGYLNDTKTVAWYVDENYVLHVHGKGKTQSLLSSGSQKPWSGLRNGTLSLNGLVVHEGITEIGNNLFAKFSYDYISLPKTLVKIGNYAFEEVFAKTVTLRSDALSEGAFMRAKIDEFIFPTTLTSIPTNCFTAVTGLKRITLHKGLSYVGGNTIPACIKEIFFTGSKEDLNYIQTIAATRESLMNITIHFDAMPFVDVYPEMWHFEYVKNLYNQQLVGGMSENTFEPDGTLTYGQALKILLLSEGHDGITPTSSHWASGYMSYAEKLGWIKSGASADSKITRLEFCRIAAKAKNITATSAANPFTDTDDESVLALVETGVIGGVGNGKFSPDTTLTRAQIAKIVSLLQELD